MSSRLRWAAAVGVALAAVAGGACRKPAPPAPPAAPGGPPTVEVLKGGRWLFTYAEPAGTFATTDKPETVPAASRGLVRVIDPAAGAPAADDRVYVTNLNDLVDKGKTTARPMSREAFETGALAALPSGQSSPFASHPAAPPPGGPAPAAPPLPPGVKPVVTIYGTSWCGACRAAREYMTSHKIPFADKDIERDPEAARELADKAAKMGIPTDRVPVLDVRGRLLLGFDPARVEALLGQPT
ncbi:MAG TPA: glutaredoxin domain-containing protein [Polyangia bacterium]|nr:glutaredoxin domain-containing protein [Polyangia bacterium]